MKREREDRMRKNDEFELEITGLSDEGLGIGKSDGFVWFVKGALPGDTVRCLAMKLKKNYGFARVKTLLKPSPERVTPRCAVEQRCGGCQLQALSYEAELRLKANKVREDLLRIGEVPAERLDAVTEPIVGMEEPSRYRNKAQVPFAAGEDGRPVAGFYAARSHRVIPWLDCDIGAKENARILEVILAFMERFGLAPYDEESGRGLIRRALIRKSRTTKGYMLCLIVNGKELPHWEALLKDLQAADTAEAHLETLVLNTNTRRDNVILGDTVRTLYGKGYIEDELMGLTFRLSPASFYQVNAKMTEKLYETALSLAQLTPNDTVLDAYCGVGTIGMAASHSAGQVIGVELNKAAVRDAIANAKRNGIENIRFFADDASDFLLRVAESGEKLDVVIMAPPRSGSTERFLQSACKVKPKRIVYVSCNPETLARDLQLLKRWNYHCERLVPIDNFPLTEHLECVALLEKKS